MSLIDKTSVKAIFSICGEGFSISAVDEILSIKGAEVRRKGDVPEGRRRPSVESSWSIGTREEASYDVGDQLVKVLELLRGKEEELLWLRKNTGLEFFFGISVSVEEGIIPAIHFDKETLRYIAELGASLDVDVRI